MNNQCPSCGYCPTCGRSNSPQPSWTYYYPATTMPLTRGGDDSTANTQDCGGDGSTGIKGGSGGGGGL